MRHPTLISILMLLLPCKMAAAVSVGDVNGDGSVDSNDVDNLIKKTLILGDANDDGSVTVSDLSTVVGIILGK